MSKGIPEVLVIPAWFNHKNNIEGIFIHEFCEAMQRNNVKVTLLYVRTYSLKKFFDYIKPVKFNLRYSYRILIIKHFKLFPQKQDHDALTRYLESLCTKVFKKVKKHTYDCIHFKSLCNNITPFIGSRLAKEMKCPYIITEHYTSYEESKGRVFQPYLTKEFVSSVVSGSQKNIAVSEFAANLYKKYFQDNFDVIPNIVAIDFFRAPFKEISLIEEFVFCFNGSLEPRKGVMELLEAFMRLSLTKNIKLHIIGEGSQREAIMEFVTKNKLTNHIYLHGKKSKAGVINMIDLSHALVSASEIETFGLTILESHLRGRPVVAVNSGGVAELINSNNGILCNPDQDKKIDNLMEAMKQMIINYDHFNLTEIRNQAIKDFSEENISNRYKEIYLNNEKTYQESC